MMVGGFEPRRALLRNLKVLGDLKEFKHLFKYKITKNINAKSKAPGTKPGASEFYGPEETIAKLFLLIRRRTTAWSRLV
jgi:hypothetical protein